MEEVQISFLFKGNEGNIKMLEKNKAHLCFFFIFIKISGNFRELRRDFAGYPDEIWR